MTKAQMEKVSVPCCQYLFTDGDHPVKWNPFNGVVQCHNCGHIWEPAAAPVEAERTAAPQATRGTVVDDTQAETSKAPAPAAAPSLTETEIEILQMFPTDFSMKKHFKPLCDLARIGRQCLDMEPVAWMLHAGKVDRVVVNITNDSKAAHNWGACNTSYQSVTPLIVKPEAK